MRNIDHFIGGAAHSSGERQGDVFDPNNGGVQARVRLGGSADLEQAVAAGDAIGNHVLRIRDTLRGAGYESEIFADDIHPPVRKYARHFLDFTPPPGGSCPTTCCARP